MESEAFFKALQHQFDKQLPFVVYRKPESSEVKALLQPVDTIFYADDFSESGFVFAPFDNNNPSILLPLSECEVLTLKDAVIPTERSDEKSQKAERFSRHTNDSVSIPQNDKSKENHINLVKKGVDTIKKGQLNKVVLSRLETVELSNANPIDIFKQLLQSYKTAFVYCWFHPKIGLWLGATPETLIKVKNNKFETMALAGTQEYKGTLDVLWGKKEQEEQSIVTNVIYRQLKNVVHEIDRSNVETVRAGNLVHLRTKIFGEVYEKLSIINLEMILNRIHPTPAVCGFPQETAKQFILENESYSRQYYTGFLGEINIENTSNLYVNLRCMQWQQNQALIYVGGGITKDSNPEAEWQETVNKSQTMISIL